MITGPELSPKLKKWWIWGLVLLAIGSLPIIFRPQPKSNLTAIAQVPEYSLLKEDGSAFGSKELAGKVYVASFVFSRCPTVCPRMLKELQGLQREFQGQGPKVAMVTFTVDPDYDTPAILNQLGKNYQADPELWSFLSSPDREALFKLYNEGFKIGVEKIDPSVDLLLVAHSEKVVLVDQKGRIRGFYSLNPEGHRRLLANARQVLEE